MSKTELSIFSQICFCFLCPLLDIWMSIHTSFCHLPSRYYWWANPANCIFFTFLLAVFSTSLIQFIHIRNTLLAVVYAGLCSSWLRCINQSSMEGEPGRLQSMGSLRVGRDWATSLSLFTFMHWRRKWQPTPVFLESQGRGSLVGCSLWGRTESDTTEVT